MLLKIGTKYWLFSVYTILGGEKLLEIKTRVLHCFTIVYIEIHFHVYQIIKCTCFSVKFVMIF